MEGPTKREISLESPEATDIVHEAIQSALTKIGGIEAIFNPEEIRQKYFSQLNHKVWSEFLSEVFKICREHDLPSPFQISIDKEKHKVLGVSFLGPNAKEILVPYSGEEGQEAMNN